MSAAMIGAAAAPVIGGIIGNMMSAGDRARAQQAFSDAYNIIGKVSAPPDMAREILYRQFEQVGLLTPEMEEAINIDVSNAAKILEDNSLRQKQSEGLEILKTLSKTGLGPEDRAAYNELRAQTQQDAEAKRQQILQNMAARGMAGSGNELIASLNASQAATNQASNMGDQIAADASARRMAALQQMISSAGNVRSADLNVNQIRATAADELARFNTANAVTRQSRNVGARNIAQEANLGTKQKVADANINQYNAEQLRQRQGELTNWENELKLAQSKANARIGQGTQFQNQAQSTASNWAQMGTGVGTGLGALGQYYQGQQTANNQAAKDAQAQANWEKEYELKKQGKWNNG